MLHPLEGPSISQGKGIVMAPVTQEKTMAPQDVAGPEKVPVASTFEGRIVSMIGDKLVMSNNEGKEYSKTVATDAKLTCDGNACRTEDLKAGHKIRVTTMPNNRTVVTGIESLNKNAAFAQFSS